MKYKVLTESTCITESIVIADNKAMAMDKAYEGDYIESKDLDYKNEQVIDIQELEF